MTVTAYRIENTDTGDTNIQQVGTFTLYSWIIKSFNKMIAGGELIIYDAMVTATQPLPQNAAIELDNQWFKVATPGTGMLGMSRHYLIQTARPQ